MKTGKINFKKTDSLKQVLKNMPNGYGVYIIYNPDNEIIYIGKAGTIKNDGSITKQDIKRRLQSPRGKYSKGEQYFKNILEIYNYEFIIFEYKIYEYPDTIPTEKESELLRQYLNKHHKLPLLNKNF